jgi:uncharacterized membrane protein
MSLGILLASPVILFLLAWVFGYSPVLPYLALLLAGGSAWLISSPRSDLSRRSEIVTTGLMLISYLVCYRLSLLWPDFISIGERLRDYAILAAVYRDPVTPAEPWMSDTTLNYYVYWYRFGQFVGALGHEAVWSVYHQLAAFSLAAYLTCIYRLLSLHFLFSPLLAGGLSLIIALGSNVQGVIHFLTRDANWWGPSRVIPGAINEFPAWSFLLGDIHPHYLNLCALPLMASITLWCVRGGWTYSRAGAAFSIWGVLTPCWLYAANAWELPTWGLLSLCALVALITLHLSRRLVVGSLLSPAEWLPQQLRSWVAWAYILIPLALALALIASTLHLRSPDNFHLRWVTLPIQRTALEPLLLHWGIPLTVIGLSMVVIVFSRDRLLGIASALMLGFGLFAGENALLLLCFMVLLALVSSWAVLTSSAEPYPFPSGSDALALALPMAFLLALIFPEIAFVDDAYGDDIERMNTIFKFYSAAWWLGWVGAALMLSQALRIVPSSQQQWLTLGLPPAVLGGAALVLLLGFTYRTIPLRKTERFTVLPFSQGLSTVDQRFPGSAEVIRRLSSESHALILEAQGNAYDYTTFVSTLAGQQSFLGWGNHVGLLTNKYDEVRRREEFTEQWYRETSCGKRNELLLAEGITHAVVGTLERTRYGESVRNNLECLMEFTRSGDYVVVSPLPRTVRVSD